MFSRASLMEGWTRDETGSCCAVKGDVDACDPPPEARVPRLDRCCYEQKVGYGRHATHHEQYAPRYFLDGATARHCQLPPLDEERRLLGKFHHEYPQDFLLTKQSLGHVSINSTLTLTPARRIPAQPLGIAGSTVKAGWTCAHFRDESQAGHENTPWRDGNAGSRRGPEENRPCFCTIGIKVLDECAKWQHVVTESHYVDS